MRASTKILLSIATFFAGAGIILFAIVMAYNNWDFKKLNTAGYYEKTVEADGQFQNISIDSDTADIRFEASGDNTCKVYAKLQEHYDLSAAADGSTLTIRVEDNTTWLDRFGLNIGSSEITVYLPEKEYLALTVDASTGDVTVPSGFSFDDVDIVCSTGDVTLSAAVSKGLKIRTSTGSILAENASPESVELTASTGKITLRGITCGGDIKLSVSTGRTELSGVTCKNLSTKGSTGKLHMDDITIAESLAVERNTGDVSFTKCTVGTFATIKTSTGDVKGSFTHDVVCIAKSDTGDIHTPGTNSGVRCEITTDTGDITIN